MKCKFCGSRNGGGKSLREHDPKDLCDNCKRKIGALDEILGEFYRAKDGVLE